MQRISFFLLLIVSALRGSAQTMPLQVFSFDSDLRMLQLNNRLPIKQSLLVRPYSFDAGFNFDSLAHLLEPGAARPIQEFKKSFWGGRGKVSLLPATSITKFTSHHPYGWSDGALAPVNGFQQLISTGVYAQLGPLSVQIKPEVHMAEDRPYPTTWQFGSTVFDRNRARAFPGQSFAELAVGPMAFAVSTENLWWGPGQFTSLMMSNHAPGFLHARIATRRPVNIGIGSIEGQIIGGRTVDEYREPDELSHLRTYGNRWGIGTGDEDISKYVNAIVLTYTPSFLKVLSLGVTRSYTSSAGNIFGELYPKVGFVKTFLPIFDGLLKENRIAFEDSLKWNQLASIFGRFRFPKSKAEIYMEYGWNDHKFNVRDFVMSPNHSAAFLIGAKKAISLNKGKMLDISVEYNQLAQQADYITRSAGNWYIHYQGSNFSHFGQSLGTGTGMGSNALIAQIIHQNGINQLGGFFEWVNRDPIEAIGKWQDFSLGWIGRKRLNHLVVNARTQLVYSTNYGWEMGKQWNIIGMVGFNYYW